ncbi:hypothetical protein WJX81_004551 [Elliptochloris bilobata]|uniref:Mediator of RNA polymerase II transcription subunit 14 n=1 Tax=Elliptochloris bilobata TaxID=381761 RepID=A0AAW1QYV2_9CHLO
MPRCVAITRALQSPRAAPCQGQVSCQGQVPPRSGAEGNDTQQVKATGGKLASLRDVLPGRFRRLRQAHNCASSSNLSAFTEVEEREPVQLKRARSSLRSSTGAGVAAEICSGDSEAVPSCSTNLIPPERQRWRSELALCAEPPPAGFLEVAAFERPQRDAWSTRRQFADIVCGVEFTPDGRLLASAGVAKQVRVYTVGDLGDDLPEHEAPQQPVAVHQLPSKMSSIAWCPDSEGIVTVGDYDGVVLQVHVASGHLVADVDEHNGRRVWSVAHSLQRRHLVASTSDDGTARLWAGPGLAACAGVLHPARGAPAYGGLRQLSERLPGEPDGERKRALLAHLHSTKQRLLRLLVVAQWANKARAVVECGRVLDVAARHAGACREAADQLAFLHGELEALRAPAWDVPTAADVLLTGGYQLLPAVIEELRPPALPPPARRRAAVRLMDQLLRARLLQEALPGGVHVVGAEEAVEDSRARWCWRPLEMRVLPDWARARDALLPSALMARLQTEVEVRMWAAADVADRRRTAAAAAATAAVMPAGMTSAGAPALEEPAAHVKAQMAAPVECAGGAVKAEGAAAGEGSGPEPEQPLAIMHGVLQEAAGRLALSEAVTWFRGANASAGGRWEGLLRVERAAVLSVGVRVCFWPAAAAVTPADVAALAASAPPPPQPGAPAPLPPPPPAIEVGLSAADGHLRLPLDLAEVDVEAALLRAAASHAALQLAALEAVLRRKGHIAANHGAGGPALELLRGGERLLVVSVHLRTGALLLATGAAQAAEVGADIAAALRKEEERLAAVAAEARARPAGAGGPARAAAERCAAALESLWLRLAARERFTQLVALAAPAGLRPAHAPATLLRAYQEAHPLAGRLPSRQSAVQMAFPVEARLPPPPPPQAPGKEGAAAAVARLARFGRGAASVRGHLVAEFGAALTWRFGLLLLSVDARGLPLQVLHFVPIPHCGGCATEAPPAPGDSHVLRTRGGLRLHYSLAAGDTAARALADVARAARLHTLLGRCMRGGDTAAELPALSVTVQWAGGEGQDRLGARESLGPAGAGAVDALPVRCRMRADAPVPAAVLRHWEDLAEAAAEGLLLDALALTGPALAVLARALAPRALVAAGLRAHPPPLSAREPPYRLRLSLCPTSGAPALEAEKDSYEKIEAPVREPVSPPVKDRQTKFDQVLKSDAVNVDRASGLTEVGVVDAMRFQGALPEVVNSRLAMLGFALAVLGFKLTGKNVWEQFKSAPGPIAAVFAIIIVASIVPVVRGTERRGFLFFQPGAEIYLGRWAMLGFVGLLWIPFINGYMLY